MIKKRINSGLTSPRAWVATLYLCQGIPYAIVSLMASILFHELDLANPLTALITSLLLLPWFLKPLWAPQLEAINQDRILIVALQGIISLLLLLIAWSLINPKPYWMLSVLFICLAFAGACYDTASDSVYLSQLNSNEQMRLVGFRSFFYQMGRLSIQGGFISLAAWLNWQITFVAMSVCLFVAMLWHQYALPEKINREKKPSHHWLTSIKQSLLRYLDRPQVGLSLVFLLIYNFAEAQIVRVTPLFLLDTHTDGGLQLSVAQTGLLLGAFGLIALALGAWLADLITPRLKLKNSLLLMAWLMAASNLAYIYLALHTQTNWSICLTLLFITQFIYGLGNAAYLAYTVNLAQYYQGSISCFSISMAIMSLGWLIPGSFSGYLAEHWGYVDFFTWTVFLGVAIALFTHYFTHVTNVA
jgi:PAT family beta-lactamase induction signal transducer AmpG